MRAPMEPGYPRPILEPVERVARCAASGGRAGMLRCAPGYCDGMTRQPHSLSSHARWNRDVRGETDIQRLDRNFLELLQELRVTQTGVQILFAFLLGLAFTPRFADLDRGQQRVYLAALLLTAASAALLIAPVAYHRMVFRRRLKSRLVQITHRCAMIGLVLLLLSVAACVELTAGMVLGTGGAVLAVAVALMFVVAWFVVPVYELRRHSGPDEPDLMTDACPATDLCDGHRSTEDPAPRR